MNQNQAEKEAEELERKIVRFTNIDKESFTHSYRGVSITIQAGESYVGRFPECNHLATHLARKILSRKAKEGSSKNDQIKLWTPEQVEKLKETILTPMGSDNPKPKFSLEEERKRDLENIKQEFVPKKTEESKKTDDSVAPQVTKKDVIAELEKRGQKPDVKKSKEELLKDLMDLEAQGK